MARPPSFDFKRARLKEIARLVMHRHGGLPDTDDRTIYLEAAAAHLNPHSGDHHFALETWARGIGATLPVEQINHIVENTKPKRIKADACARMLMVTDAERTLLKLTTIGACDLSRAERIRRRKARNRKAMQARRRARGALARAEYLANSLSRAKPWEALGISRRTWERRGKPAVTQIRVQPSSSQVYTDLRQRHVTQQRKTAEEKT
jgi:hypothetical protein